MFEINYGCGRGEYFEVAVNVLDYLLFVVVLNEARLDEVVEFGEDEGFFHFGDVVFCLRIMLEVGLQSMWLVVG